MDIADTCLFARSLIPASLHQIPISSPDTTALDRLSELAQTNEAHFFELATANGIEITPGIWSAFLQIVIHHWDDHGHDGALLLPELREIFAGTTLAPPYRNLLDATAVALSELGWMSFQEDVPQHSVPLMEALYRLARESEQLGNVDNAYDLAACAIDLGREIDRAREEIVRYAITLGLAADRIHQVAVCSVELARIVAIEADDHPERRLEAFDSCERALEFISLAPEPFRQIAASDLAEILDGRDYLRKLLLPLLWYLPPDQRPPMNLNPSEFKSWPERVSIKPLNEWLDSLGEVLAAGQWDLELENVRLSLEGKLASTTAEVDWTGWKVDHVAYRRAVPHNRSFLRERDFNSHFLVLTHELTHVLSLLGGIGIALTSLRVALIDAEITLWSTLPGASSDSIGEAIARDGVAPLLDGNAGSMMRAEQSLELTIKAHVLQDVWTPWLEGLAIFGEIAADPKLDPTGIGEVTACLRNFLDFNPQTQGSTNVADPEEAHIAFETLAKEFEERCSAAIACNGSGRLERYLRATDPIYLAGFLAVRTIVSAWRATTGRSLTGTEAFALLLHATRYGTLDAIPDLSLRSDLFASAALDFMCNWAAGLAQLSRSDIERFLVPSEIDKPRFSFEWKDGRPCKVEGGESADRASLCIEGRVRQALLSLSRTEDLARVFPRDTLLEMMLSGLSEAVAENVAVSSERTASLAVGLIGFGSLVPVGHAACKFTVNIDRSSQTSYLFVQIRTTEVHISDGRPSVNGYMFPIEQSDGELIAKEFRRLGSPRMEVVRLIALGGSLQLPTGSGSHLLAFSYGHWFAIRGAGPFVDSLLSQDDELRENVREAARKRLHPQPLLQAEIAKVAPGRRGAERTRDWIDRSTQWALDDQPLPIEAWVSHVRSLADRVLDEDGRLACKRDSASSLLETLTGKREFAREVVTKGFESLTATAPGRRVALVEALTKTAQVPSSDVAVGSVIQEFEQMGLGFFSRGPNGWDILAAAAAANRRSQEV